MCIKITQNKIEIIPNSIGIVKTKQGNKPLPWGIPGNFEPRLHARIETLRKKWLDNDYEVGTMTINSFIERDTNFEFDNPKDIGVIYKNDHFLIVTEPASLQIARVHHRQPCYREIKTLITL